MYIISRPYKKCSVSVDHLLDDKFLDLSKLIALVKNKLDTATTTEVVFQMTGNSGIKKKCWSPKFSSFSKDDLKTLLS